MMCRAVNDDGATGWKAGSEMSTSLVCGQIVSVFSSCLLKRALLCLQIAHGRALFLGRSLSSVLPGLSQVISESPKPDGWCTSVQA